MTSSTKWTIREFLSLIWLNLIVRIRNLKESFKVILKYYANFSFFKADLSLRLMYLFHNPFAVSKRFLMEQGADDVYTYGETPLTTLEKIAKECQLSEHDCVYELGCGRGRTCLWLNSFIGCHVVGIEHVPEFVEKGNRLVNKLNMDKIQFRCADMLKTKFTGATVCYLYGTCLEEEAIQTLIAQFATLPAGTKIITVSYPLTDFTNNPRFEVVKSFNASFTWGDTEVYLHRLK